MEPFDKDRCIKPADKFKAPGHPVRLWMARQLLAGEHCVHEFVDLTGLDFSTISQHMNALKHAGVVTDGKRGKHVFYRLCRDCVRTFLECVDTHMKAEASKNSRPS